LPGTCRLGREYRLFYEYTAGGEYLYALKKKDKEACRKEQALLNREIESDLDDGVTGNYKLFEGVVAKIK